MTQEIVIQLRITVPDGASYRVISAPEPDSVLSEPIPPPPGVESDPAFESTARRGIAVQPGAVWLAGQVHAKDHKPLKQGAEGLFCPTKLGQKPDGSDAWCSFRP